MCRRSTGCCRMAASRWSIAVSIRRRTRGTMQEAWRASKGRGLLVVWWCRFLCRFMARFQGARDVGGLEVSFFGPFYGAYNVLVLDADYRYALVAGPNRDYLWILAREPQRDRATLDTLVVRAKGWGFASDALIYVDQTPRVQ